jgi:hypothetical protein
MFFFRIISMLPDMNLQIISNFGWYEIIDGKIKLRKEGIVELGEIAPPRLHVHKDGVTILGLPKSAIAWIMNCIDHENSHDVHGNKETEPVEKTATVTIRLG